MGFVLKLDGISEVEFWLAQESRPPQKVEISIMYGQLGMEHRRNTQLLRTALRKRLKIQPP